MTAITSTEKEALDAAIWVTASPHEWVWTHDQQVAMARYCLEAARRLDEAARMLGEIVITVEPDRGVMMLSSDSPTYYCPERKCQVYKHKNFSPLGDALIELHETLTNRDAGKPDWVRIWSYEHNAYWGHHSCGYVSDGLRAGLYKRDEAERIVKGANHGNTLNEAIVELDEFPKEKWELQK